MAKRNERERQGRRSVHILNRACGALVVAALGFDSTSSAQSVPAFPGADGAGAAATGGRGGLVYHVTRLDGEINGDRFVFGTLGYGMQDSNFTVNGVVQPRTIVFDVGGTIWLGRKGDTEGWDTQDPLTLGSKITIAGQTAPGGINIMGGGLKVNGNNAIIRNLNIAPGYGTRSLNSATGYADSYVYDAMNIRANNVMVDHVSAVFATDETISMDEVANNVTVQYSNISQGQNYPQADAENPGVYTGHALGSLIQPGSNAKISVLHNLYAHLKGRLPRVGTESDKLTVPGVGSVNDFRNNVFYNWLSTAGSGASGQPSTNNFVGNLYLAGPGGDDNTGSMIVNKAGGTGIFSGSNGPTGVYHSGNVKDTNKDGDALDGVALANSDFGSSTFSSSAYAVPYFGVTDTAAAAFDRVLNYAGANWNNRNAIDARIVNETRTGTGKIMAFNDPTHGTEWNDLLALRMDANGNAPFTRPAGFDTDGDGMPNTWELEHGLNPAAADNNGDYDADGYTNLEEYINELSEWTAPRAIVFSGATNARFEQITNWDILWQPSRYDEARINSGTVTLDSVGQHAGTLSIAATAGGNATFAVSSGWIDVANVLRVGAAGNGNLVQSGGLINVGTATVVGSSTGSLSTYTMAGGALVTPSLQLLGGGKMILTPGADKFLRVNSLAIDTAKNSRLDLADNDLHIAGGNGYLIVTNWIAMARNGGAWNGAAGIASSAAASNANHSTTLGTLTGAEYLSTGPGTFDGSPVSPGDVLVKYTWYGDTDLNGVVNFDDYVRADNGFNNHLSGWFNGDFDYNGAVNFDDYVLIDLAFNTQSGTLRRALTFLDGSDRSSAGMDDPALQKIEQHFEQFGEAYARGLIAAVPEPTGLSIFAVGATCALCRRLRRRR